MIEVACRCGGLPAHDHYMGQVAEKWGDALQQGVAYDDLVWGPRYDLDDIGRVWVPWKQVARALSDTLGSARP